MVQVDTLSKAAIIGGTTLAVVAVCLPDSNGDSIFTHPQGPMGYFLGFVGSGTYLDIFWLGIALVILGILTLFLAPHL